MSVILGTQPKTKRKKASTVIQHTKTQKDIETKAKLVEDTKPSLKSAKKEVEPESQTKVFSVELENENYPAPNGTEIGSQNKVMSVQL